MGRRVRQAKLRVGGERRLFAQQGHEIRVLQRLHHGAQAVRAFRVVGPGVVAEAGRVGEQGDGAHAAASARRRMVNE